MISSCYSQCMNIDSPSNPPSVPCSNLLSVRVDSLYSVPEAWLPVGAPGHRFELALTVPTAEELTTTLLLNNGCLRNPPSKVRT